jgi:succinoglycan biosynthesis protein ExoV
MKLHYQKSVQGNFGDALNEWLWPRFLPGMWADDGVVFAGIGTIFDDHSPAARIRVVLGSGAGYAPVPDLAATKDSWRIYGVRGPLTAAVLRLDADLALTDPAILIAEMPEFPRVDGGATLFIPHWKSLKYGAWREVCARLGIEFVDPLTPSEEVVRRIAGARKVIAESMHAAIIADAFRVPWVPIALSREISPFKWSDWSQSKGLVYAPFCLPPSSAMEALRDTFLRRSVFECFMSYPAPERLRAMPVVTFDDRAALMRDFDVICVRLRQPSRRKASFVGEAIFKRLAVFAMRHAQHDGRRFEEATSALAAVKAMDGTLSAEDAHRQAREKVHDALARLKSDWARGFPALTPSTPDPAALPHAMKAVP